MHHDRNRKLGGSIKSGFAAATGDLVLYTDADLPFEMIELVRAIRVLRTYEADMVSAYRLDRTGEGPRRAVYSWVYNWLIRLYFGTRLRDINFAFKLCRRTVLDRVTLSSEGSFIDAELMIRAQKAGFSIVQIGVDYFPRTRGVSTLSSPSVIRTMLGEMNRLRGELKALPTGDPGVTALLVISADDFGLTDGVCRAVLQGYQQGIVTSTSLLAVGRSFDLAVRMIDDHPDLDVGAHLAIVGEDPPLLTAGEIPSLVDRRGRSRCPTGPWCCAACAGRLDPADVRAEFGAQLERIRSAGVAVSHLDTHQHTHLWPSVAGVLVDLARESGIGAVRTPRQRAAAAGGIRGEPARRAAAEQGAAGRAGHHRRLCRVGRGGLARPGPIHRGLHAVGRVGGTVEINSHPGVADDPDLGRFAWGYRWADELAMLTSPATRSLVESHGYRLGSFRDLVTAP